jgi:hypothetical protein
MQSQYLQISSVVAVGYVQRIHTVHWKLVRKIVLAWVCTIPATGLFHFLISNISNIIPFSVLLSAGIAAFLRWLVNLIDGGL